MRYICIYLYTEMELQYIHMYIYADLSIYIRKTVTKEKQKFVFLGRQRINGNQRLLFHPTCLSVTIILQSIRRDENKTFLPISTKGSNNSKGVTQERPSRFPCWYGKAENFRWIIRILWLENVCFAVFPFPSLIWIIWESADYFLTRSVKK